MAVVCEPDTHVPLLAGELAGDIQVRLGVDDATPYFEALAEGGEFGEVFELAD